MCAWAMTDSSRRRGHASDVEVRIRAPRAREGWSSLGLRKPARALLGREAVAVVHGTVQRAFIGGAMGIGDPMTLTRPMQPARPGRSSACFQRCTGKWWALVGSNHRPLRCQRSVLPTFSVA